MSWKMKAEVEYAAKVMPCHRCKVVGQLYLSGDPRETEPGSGKSETSVLCRACGYTGTLCLMPARAGQPETVTYVGVAP